MVRFSDLISGGDGPEEPDPGAQGEALARMPRRPEAAPGDADQPATPAPSDLPIAGSGGRRELPADEEPAPAPAAPTPEYLAALPAIDDTFLPGRGRR